MVLQTLSFTFSQNSQKQLDTCHNDLIRIVNKALSYGVLDITVIEGHRTYEQQHERFLSGASQMDGIERQSKHQRNPSMAVDIAPYPINWENHRRFTILAGLMFAAAAELNIKIRWGGAWRGLESKSVNKPDDLVHFELV